MMDEALEEHHVVKAMIKELRKMQPKDERYRAKFKVLNEIVKHHVEEDRRSCPRLKRQTLTLMLWDKRRSRAKKS